MRKIAAVLAAAAALSIAPAAFAADEHVATPGAVEARLAEAVDQRAADLAAVDSLLASPLAREAASTLGADVERLRAGVPALSDSDLRDLASRASALETDPVAGALTSNQRLLVTIALILIVIILLLSILD